MSYAAGVTLDDHLEDMEHYNRPKAQRGGHSYHLFPPKDAVFVEGEEVHPFHIS
jgi:hypothetical protein